MTVGAGFVVCILTPIAAWLWFDVAHESGLPGLGRRELRTHVHRYWCALLRNQRDHVHSEGRAGGEVGWAWQPPESAQWGERSGSEPMSGKCSARAVGLTKR